MYRIAPGQADVCMQLSNVPDTAVLILDTESINQLVQLCNPTAGSSTRTVHSGTWHPSFVGVFPSKTPPNGWGAAAVADTPQRALAGCSLACSLVGCDGAVQRG
jgi:hypothetical protein